MEEAHRAECIHGNVLQWPPQLNFSPWVNLTDQGLSWSVYKYIYIQFHKVCFHINTFILCVIKKARYRIQQFNDFTRPAVAPAKT